MNIIEKICCCFKRKEKAPEFKLAYENQTESGVLDSTITDSEEVRKRIEIDNEFLSTFKQKHLISRSNSFSEDITPKRGLKKCYEYHEKNMERQRVLKSFEDMNLDEADKYEYKRQKLIRSKKKEVEGTLLAANECYKKRANDSIEKVKEAAKLEEQINKDQTFIIKKIKMYKEQDFSSKINNTNESLKTDYDQFEESMIFCTARNTGDEVVEALGEQSLTNDNDQ